jgi:ElaA protein
MDNYKILCKSYNELSTDELYRILQLRQEVFVVEQDCPYLDADGKDQLALHAWIQIDSEIEAYLRMLPKGTAYDDYSSIGRVISTKKWRAKGLGKSIMKYALHKMQDLWPKDDIKISAQVYIIPFYESLGFKKTGEPYLEDDIPHHAMIYSFEEN